MVFALALVAAPRVATAAIIVAEPTGDAEPALLAELEASLEAVVAGAAAEIDAELRSSATIRDEGVELVVELAPRGGEPVRETRIASVASSLAQARAMARSAIRALVAPKPEPTVAVQKEVTPKVEPPPPLPVPDRYYSRSGALLMTLIPTLVLPPFGSLLITVSVFVSLAGSQTGFYLCVITGSVFSGFGMTLAPAIGYFWIGRWKHGLAMSGLRLLTLATGAGTLVWYLLGATNDRTECEEGSENRSSSCDVGDTSKALLAFSIMSLTATVFLAYLDAVFVWRAADRSNERRSKSLNKGGEPKPARLEISAAPVAWPSGNGDTAFGLAVGGRF